ncbi:hypothetical protein HELRODRAFT_161972 [Helobdella robusta]|uniref:CDK5 regulatory subunit-associated protein 1 n=1 Tax=Helobdella robusta TaxID=6412 RepID=T1ES40_HELRO|nr:hypothetical protein HELRODRAFT_161972 [Helobdella robusta]ESO02680.1 hypothetical protein HELRODRAFT_161972 [Helobdella robusta]
MIQNLILYNGVKLKNISLIGKRFLKFKESVTSKLNQNVITDCNSNTAFNFIRRFSSEIKENERSLNFKHFLRNSPIESSTKLARNSCKEQENDADYYNDGCCYFPEEDCVGGDEVGDNKKVFIEVYGCQMNNNDAEIVNSILTKSGYKIIDDISQSDVVLLMTCSIREGAEQKIWRRVEYLNNIKRSRIRGHRNFKIGILGCMAERLKQKILEKNDSINLICGPDAYRSLPKLLADVESGGLAANVQLSLDETYADIQPVRREPNSVTAFVSIMRGCNNMCTYCVVPFTRGREKSRPMTSILEEVKRLVDQGVKDITLLGQNVNSYRDTTAPKSFTSLAIEPIRTGFKTVYKQATSQSQACYRFVDLLDRISLVDKEVRVRFTSPHPKDFPNEVIQLISSRPNICRQLHIPAQSGSDAVLERMMRGYDVETPDVSLSSDFIAGFCGESERDHELTLQLMSDVKYNMAYCFPYSIREKTGAYRRLSDDVPSEVKKIRMIQLVDCFRSNADLINRAMIGSHQLVLVEGTSRRKKDQLYGRNDGNTKVILDNNKDNNNCINYDNEEEISEPIRVGDYVLVEVGFVDFIAMV